MTEQTPDLEFLSRIELYFSMRQMTRTLRRFAERLDQDYDSVLLFLIVVEDGFRAIFHLAPSMVAEQDFHQLYMDVASEGLSLLQIGESSGVARETVRRKIKQLIDLKYLALNPKNKNVYLPYSTITNPMFSEIFRMQIDDVEKFIRSAQYYTAPRA